MKVNRLIETVILLLNRDVVTARELAERFQVSTRTIYRDVDDLSAAGVPVYMARGKGGGISLLPDYSLNKVYLSEEDRKNLALAVQTLQVTRLPDIDSALQRIGALLGGGESEQWAQVDFTPWGSNPDEAGRFTRAREAIVNRRIVSFQYVNSRGEVSFRQVEPVRLMYKGHAWYLYGFCRLRDDYRVFRLSRVKDLHAGSESFSRKQDRIPGNLEFERPSSQSVTLKLKFGPAVTHRVYDDFDARSIVTGPDSSSVVTAAMPEDEWVYGYILSFADQVEVLEPDRVRNIIESKLKNTLAVYQAGRRI